MSTKIFYASFTIRYQEKDSTIDYIKNQREHHKKEDFKTEYRRFITESGIDINEKYFLTD
ncbi:MAG TPA: hypothetical protein PLW77_01695 [Bacteroidales bacterium]|nr:hypothetical protein [Bacteroidales bacterium]HQB21152.1 hypothetical protein [Bacteroidales bacterium]